ncbi:DnaA regulatory inactivator Hda [Aquirhabdus sp.]|uniref:DnaA regulatory inactivator Hda n=1 Tax=Aquirhabdus sp. TaxID=2824160 RepID=UPI00396CF6D8
MRQLNLAIDVRSDARISDFAGPGWASVIDATRQLHAGLLSRCFIHGVADTGKTHLLSAICESYLDVGRTAIQVSLIELVHAPTEVLQALESFDLVALDDLDAVVGMPHWEEAIYHLINRSEQRQLVFVARSPATHLPIGLPDLQSRLAQAASFGLPVGDNVDDRRALLFAVLKRNGWQFDPAITEHLIEHGSHRPGLMLKTLAKFKPLFQAQRRKPSLALIRQTMAMIDQDLIDQNGEV